MSDASDDAGKAGLIVTAAVVAFVVVGVVGSLIFRHMNHAKAGKGAASAPVVAVAAEASAANAVAVAVEPPAVAPAAPVAAEAAQDIPLSGDLAGAGYFGSGQAKVDAKAPALLKVIELLKKQGDKRIMLAGFHDRTGDPVSNAELAKNRALSVRDALVAAGVPSERVILRKPEQTAAGGTLREARRVEFRILP